MVVPANFYNQVNVPNNNVIDDPMDVDQNEQPFMLPPAVNAVPVNPNPPAINNAVVINQPAPMNVDRLSRAQMIQRFAIPFLNARDLH